MGVDKVIKLCRKFGITSRLVPNLPLALGASDLTLLEHTSAFTTFPDDGVHIAPRMIQRVTNYDGRVIDDFPPDVTDVLPAPIARLEVSMLREVINSGTGTRAKALKRPLAGKTGTTNEFSDAWFMGFSPSLTCGVWVGFDDHQTLGPKEEGAKVALPIWMNFMGEALKDKPVEDFPNSPLLTDPEQVKEILAGGGAERLMAQRGTEVCGKSDSSAGLPVGRNAGALKVTGAEPKAEVRGPAPHSGKTVLAGEGVATSPKPDTPALKSTSPSPKPAASLAKPPLPLPKTTTLPDESKLVAKPAAADNQR